MNAYAEVGDNDLADMLDAAADDSDMAPGNTDLLLEAANRVRVAAVMAACLMSRE